MSKERFSIHVERDHAEDAAIHGGWKVTKYHRGGWTVVFRGDIAECQDHAQDLAEDQRIDAHHFAEG